MTDKFTLPELLGGEEPLLDADEEEEGVSALLESLTDDEQDALVQDPSMLVRHLRAEKGNVSKALEKFRATLQWRKEFGVDQLVQCTTTTQSDNDTAAKFLQILQEEALPGKMYVRGYDRDGRALLYMRGDLENTHHPDNNMRHLVWNLEKAIACTRRQSQKLRGTKYGLEKIILMQDFTNFSLSTAPPLSVSQHTLHILQSHYPERVHSIVCFNAPFVFKAFWEIVKPFVDPATQKKILFVSGEAGLADFHDMFDSCDALEEVAGGTALDTLAPWDSAAYLNLPFDVAFDEKDVDDDCSTS